MNTESLGIARWDGRAWLSLGPAAGSPSKALRRLHSLTEWNDTLVAGSETAVSSWNGIFWRNLALDVTPQRPGLAAGIEALGTWKTLLVAGERFAASQPPARNLAVFDGA